AAPVLTRDPPPAEGGRVDHERRALPVLVAEHPGSTVDLDEHRTPPPVGAGRIDVEQVAAAAGAVGDVAHPLDLRVPEGEGEQELREGLLYRHPVAGRRLHPVEIARPERLDERL